MLPTKISIYTFYNRYKNAANTFDHSYVAAKINNPCHYSKQLLCERLGKNAVCHIYFMII